jgi:flagellar assembly protein FliH
MTRSNNKFIAEEDILAVSDWSFGAVDQVSIRFAAKLKAQADAEKQAKEVAEQEKIDAIRQTGFTKGFEDGFAQGHAQATLEAQRQMADYIRHEGQQAANHFTQLFGAAQQQISESEQAIALGVLELACEVARQVVRRELSVNPNAVLPVIRESLSILLSDGKTAIVRMNPLDVEMLASDLREEFSSLDINVATDSSLTRGGCLVEAAGTVVDGTVERRWQRSIASLGLESNWESDHDTIGK